MIGHQPMQSADPGYPLRQATTRQHPTLVVLHLDVVMGLRPIVPDEQHRNGLLRLDEHDASSV